MELVRFKEMPYTRPDLEKIKAEMSALIQELTSAEDYPQAKEVFLKEQNLEKHIMTQATLAQIRHSIDTRDPFYDQEETFWNRSLPGNRLCSCGRRFHAVCLLVSSR